MTPHLGLHQLGWPTDSAVSQSLLLVKVAFVITTGLKWEEGVLVPILLFFIFVFVVVIFTLALYYSLSTVEEQTMSRRCHMAHEMRHRRQTRRQRAQCRFEI